MEIDGIDVSIIYPSIGCMLYGGADSELLTSNCRSYNDWVGEFCSAVPKRLKGIAMLNVDDVGVAVKELERCAKMGFVGAMITVFPLRGGSTISRSTIPCGLRPRTWECPLAFTLAPIVPAEIRNLQIPMPLRPPLYLTWTIGCGCLLAP